MPATNDKLLFVIRGGRDHLDPTYACTSHNTKPGNYALLEVDPTQGRVTGRKIESHIEDVHKEAAKYRGVYLDTRNDANLIEMPRLPNSEEADLDILRRPKSDEEILAMHALSSKTVDLIQAEGMTEARFRGECKMLGNKSYFKVHHGTGFTEYRGGMQDEKGRCSDHTFVVANSKDWENRFARVKAGLDAVYDAAKEGALISDLEATFRGFLDSSDVPMSPCIEATGYESHEIYKNFTTLNAYDFVRVGVAISNGKDTALVYRAVKDIAPRSIELPEPIPAPVETKTSFKPQRSQPDVVNPPYHIATPFRGVLHSPRTSFHTSIESVFA